MTEQAPTALAESRLVSAEGVLDIVRLSPDLIRIADDAGVVIYASDASSDLLGRSPCDVVGSPFGEFDLPWDNTSIERAQAEAEAADAPVTRVHRVLQGGGGYRWLETSVRVLQTVRGRFTVLVSRSVVAPGIETSNHPHAQRPRVPGEGISSSISGDPQQAEALARARYLTDRERQVLVGLGEGATVQALAHRLHIRECTVRGHIRSLRQKLQVHSQLQAVLVGMRAGVVPLDGNIRGL